MGFLQTLIQLLLHVLVNFRSRKVTKFMAENSLNRFVTDVAVKFRARKVTKKCAKISLYLDY